MTVADELKAGNSSVLLERLRASDKLHYILDDENELKKWTGELPIKHPSLFSPFPAVKARLVKIEIRQSEDLALQGTECLLSH
ncbi:hypothetical protein Plhal304r1_c029g0095641 [Plasmopara halstedii]